MKKEFLLTALVCIIMIANAQNNTTDDGVVINGVRWATRNVDKPGTFTANPEDFGGLYQWNRGTTDWEEDWNGNGASVWQLSNNPCPAGWRVPTQKELESLAHASVAATVNGVNGRLFSDISEGNDGSVTLFLPAAGYRLLYGYDAKNSVGSHGYYWSSTDYGATVAFRLRFDLTTQVTAFSINSRAVASSVRCVAE